MAIVSIVIPVRNDAAPLQRLLATLRAGFPEAEVVVVDGGSTDGSADVALGAGVCLERCRPGRGFQLAAGTAAARGAWIWMLHADSEPSLEAIAHLRGRADQPGWGRYSITFGDPAGTAMALVALLMNWRSRITGICTGDQGIFVHVDLLREIGGVPAQSLMEDIELSARLRRLRRPDCRPERVGTSPRRWQARGTLRTILAMWWFRLRYWSGADPEVLARDYYRP
jgi:rSAM/selenodomain-associated transferase 2